jgi:CspA family cold shock protein
VATGTVMKYFEQKGFGFIKPDDGEQDVFVHCTEVKVDGFASLDTGQRVNYEITEGPRGLKATNVTLLEA